MTTMAMLTPRVVADSRRLRPPRRSLSPLSPPSFLSSSRTSLPMGSLFPPHAWPPSHCRARARASPPRTTVPSYPLTPSNPANSRGPPSLSLSFSLSLSLFPPSPLSFFHINRTYCIFHRNECAGTAVNYSRTCRCTYRRARARARVGTPDSRQRRRWCRCTYR